MNPQTREQQCSYVLVLFPRSEDSGGILNAVTEAGQIPLICHCLLEAQEVMKHEQIQVIICEDHLPQETMDAVLKLARHGHGPIPVIVASRTGGWEEYLDALRQGAFDYLTLPPRREEVRRVLELALAESCRVLEDGTAREVGRFRAREFVLALGENKFPLDPLAKAETWEARLPRKPLKAFPG
jgi:DNA-binding NtrC family response regulator